MIVQNHVELSFVIYWLHFSQYIEYYTLLLVLMCFLKLFNISNDKEIFLHFFHVFFCVYKILHLFPNIATYFATFFQKFSLIILEFPHHCFKIFSSNCYTYFVDKVIRNSFWLVGKIALSPVQHPYICQII